MAKTRQSGAHDWRRKRRKRLKPRWRPRAKQIRQPDFALVTPPKTVLPKDHNPETGSTPYDDWRVLNHRVNCPRPGVPGDTFENPFCLATPTRAE